MNTYLQRKYTNTSKVQLSTLGYGRKKVVGSVVSVVQSPPVWQGSKKHVSALEVRYREVVIVTDGLLALSLGQEVLLEARQADEAALAESLTLSRQVGRDLLA